MNITGKILEINNAQQVSDTFKKRAFVLEYMENPQYPETISFELVQDKCDILNQFQVGQEVTVHFNLRGRKWVNPEGVARYFNSLQAWRIEAGNTASGASTSHQAAASQGTASPSASVATEVDDLPF